MTTENNWKSLAEEHDVAFFNAEICLESPQSFSLEEKRQICEAIDASMAEIDAAMRSDFEAMPPIAQAKMLDLLQKADPDNIDWWIEILIGEMPDSPDMLTK